MCGLKNKLIDDDWCNYIKTFDFITLTETHTTSDVDIPDLFVNYDLYWCHAVKTSEQARGSGGILVMVKKCFSSLVQKLTVNCDNVIVLRLSKRVLGSDSDCLFVSVYVPPTGSSYYNVTESNCLISDIESCVLDLLTEHEDIEDIICNGDFNARTGIKQANINYWQDLENNGNEGLGISEGDLFLENRVSQDLSINDFGKKLLEFCLLFDLKIVNGCDPWDTEGKLTYTSIHGNSLVDYFLVSNGLFKLISKLTVTDRSDSDHMPVELYFYSTPEPIMNGESRPTLSTVRKNKFVWQESKKEEVIAQLESAHIRERLEWAEQLLADSVDESLSVFNTTLLETAKCMVKTTCVGNEKQRKSPWFDKECREKKRRVNKLLKKYRNSKVNGDFILYQEARKDYKITLRDKANRYKEIQAERLVSTTNNSKEFWSEVRKYRANKRLTKNNISLQEWINYFDKVLNEGVEIGPNDEAEAGQNNDEDVDSSIEVLDADITTEEVSKAINKMKNNKAAGPDGIVAELIKLAENNVVHYLTKLFNKIFQSGSFPREWTRSIIIPIHKKGDPSLSDNYRGISLLSIISKVYTFVLNNRLKQWSEENNIINDAQEGFRKGRSTINHIFTLHALIEKQFLSDSKLYVAFMDFRKCYDTINRNILWSVLLKSGVQGKMLRALRGIYSSVQACVLGNEGLSEYFQCLQGLKQGCILSPELFSLLINDLALEILSKARHGVSLGVAEIELFLLLFADDLTLIATTIVGLQNQLNVLHTATVRLGLTINLEKSKVVVFRKGGFLGCRERWFFGGGQLDVVNSFKFLGLIFSTRLSFIAAMEDAATRAKKCTVEILRALRKINCISPVVFFKLFDSQVTPILLYGAEVWGYKQFVSVERVHLFACKSFLRVCNKTPNDVVYGELGRFPLYITALIKCVKYWLKLLSQPENCYSKKCYNMLLMLHNRGKATWASHVRNILVNNGFEQVWLFGCGSEKLFVRELRERLFSSFIHGWFTHISTSENVGMYGTFKSVFVREKYTMCIKSESYRSALARFRMGVSEINKHKFRFSKNRQEKCCKFCKQKIEDEIHFVFVCPKYGDLRSKFLYFVRPEEHNETLVNMLNTDNEELIKKLAMYIFFAQKSRSR